MTANISISRRDALKTTVAAGLAAGASPAFSLASESAGPEALGKAEHCIVMWLGGGPSQIDTFDPKRQSKDGKKIPGVPTPRSTPPFRACSFVST